MMNPVHLSRAATAAFLLLGAVWAGALPEAVDRQVSREPVAGGVELIRIRQFDAEGWLNIFALEADLANPAVGLDSLLGNETLTRPERLTDLAERRGAVGAVNADFFFIRTTNAPLGVHFQSGEVVKSPTPGREMSFVMAPGEAAIGQAVFRGTVTTANRETRALNRWNEPMVAADQIGFYNRRWGARAQGTASADFAEVSGIVHAVAEAGGRVTALLEDAPGPEIPKDGFVLLGRGSGAEWLRARARPGARLAVDAKLDFPLEEAVAAVGGNPRLLRNGEIVAPDNPVHPRTAAGYNTETGRAWLVVVDGRSRSSRGVDFRDLAEIFLELGATEALNLDGGGSSTLVARDSLQARPLLRNVPSDGRIRLVPNGVGIFSRMPEQTTIHHLHLHPPAPVDEYLLSGREIRAVPGLPVEVAVSATDAVGNPASLVPADIRWRVEPPSLGKVGDDGRFQPLASGRGTLTAGHLDPSQARGQPAVEVVVGDDRPRLADGHIRFAGHRDRLHRRRRIGPGSRVTQLACAPELENGESSHHQTSRPDDRAASHAEHSRGDRHRGRHHPGDVGSGDRSGQGSKPTMARTGCGHEADSEDHQTGTGPADRHHGDIEHLPEPSGGQRSHETRAPRDDGVDSKDVADSGGGQQRLELVEGGGRRGGTLVVELGHAPTMTMARGPSR